MLRIWIAALAAAATCVAQTSDCEQTCEPKMVAAVKCSTFDCYCYAYDDPAYVSCLQSECGKGYSSVREIQVSTCSYLGVTLDPQPPGGGSAPTGTATTGTSPTAGSGSGSGSATGTAGSGSGSGGGSTSNGGTSGGSSTTGSSSPPAKEGLTTAEIIGIVIGSVSAVTAVIGLIYQIKRRRSRTNAAASPPMYHQVPQPPPPPPPANVPYAPVNNIHVAPVFYPNNAPAGGYQKPPPPYQQTAHPYQQTIHVNWK